MNIEVEVLTSVLTGVCAGGVAFGMFRGTITRAVKDVEKAVDVQAAQIQVMQAGVAMKRDVSDCIEVRGQCKEEIFRVLADLKAGQAQIYEHLLRHADGGVRNRKEDQG